MRDANNTYIGKTIQYLVPRVKEHGTSASAVFNQLTSCETCKSIVIIDSGKNGYEITVKEAY